MLRSKAAAIIATAVVVLLSVSYLLFVHHTEPYELGLVYDKFGGELYSSGPGWHITAPWVRVSNIDTRPQRICNRTASRAYKCKLARFVPEYFQEFVDMEGFHYYWLYNRASFNFGHPVEYRGMQDILYGYAFSEKSYPFIEVTEQTE